MRNVQLLLFLFLFGAITSGCGGAEETDPSPVAEAETSATPAPTDSSEQPSSENPIPAVEERIEDPEEEVEIDPPEPVPTHWCDALGAGTLGERIAVLDFARAHTAIALFGPSSHRIEKEEALALLLEDDSLLNEEDLTSLLGAWVSNASGLCLAEGTAVSDTLPTVEVQGDVALVTPGAGTPTLPAEVAQVVINLTALEPGHDVAAAVGIALAEDATAATRRVRKFLGLPAFGEDWTHYESSLDTVNEQIVATGQKDLPIAFWVGPGLTPEAARIAGGMRLSGMARIVGEMNLFTEIAESCWSPVGDQGIAWRCAVLIHNDAQWPDFIVPDAPMSDTWAEVFASELSNIDQISTRPAAEPYNRAEATTSDVLTRGTMRAAVLAGYGIFDWFYPYFDLMGRDLDTALPDALAEINGLDSGDRTGFMKTLGRFMHDLYDGHGFYSDWAGTDWPDGYLAAQIKQVDGAPVVRFSAHEGLNAGDTIISIDGVPAEDWYEEAMSRYSAASEGYRFVLATDELTGIRGTLELGLRSPDGEERTESFSPKGYTALDAVPWGGTLRESGWLSELGKPDIYYLNMANAVTPDVSGFFEEFDDIRTQAAGMVLDMRDYPHLDIYELARYFNEENFTAPHFGFPTWTGPEDYELVFDIWPFTALEEPYLGPVALIVSNHSVSAAECISQMLMDLEHVTVVGQQSASTNGTITNFRVPGNIEFTFTGMRLLNLDGTDFHGIGVIPDVEVTPTALEFAEGVDPELEAAIQVIDSVNLP